MDLHRLRVVNFDRRTSEENTLEKCSSFAKHSKNGKSTNIDQILRSNTSGEGGDVPNCRRTLNNKKLNSVNLTVPTKRKTSKKYLCRNASLDILKRKFLLKHNDVPSTAFPHHFEDSVRGSNRRFKRKKYTKKNQRESDRPSDDIQILFTNKTLKTAKVPRKCNSKHGISCKRSKSMFDLFGMHTNNRLFGPRYSYNINYNNRFRQKKSVRWKPSDKTCMCCREFRQCRQEKSVSLRNIRPGSPNRFCVPMHYNLVAFPDRYDTKLNTRRSSKIYQNEISPNEFQCNDQEVSVTPSCLQTPVKCVTDAGVTTSHCFYLKTTSKINNSKQEVHKCSSDENKQFDILPSNRGSDIVSKVLPFAKPLSKQLLTSGESIVKYILFGLIFAVWLPCIIIILLFWVLTYPLRPHSNLTGTLPSKQDSCIPTCNSSWTTYMSRIFNFLSGTVDRVFYFGKAIVTLLKNKKDCKRSSDRQTPHESSYYLHSRRKHPNPKRKYTLFYSENRGWTMKPIPHQLVDKRTHIVQTLQHWLFRQDSIEKNKNLSSKTILKKHGSKNECRCLSATKKVTIDMPSDKTDITPQSPQNMNEISQQFTNDFKLKQTQVQRPQMISEIQHQPVKLKDKGHYFSKYHNQPHHHDRSPSLHHSLKINLPSEKQLKNHPSLYNTYGHQHDFTKDRPPQNYLQQLHHLPAADNKTMKSQPQASHIFQHSHHKMLRDSTQVKWVPKMRRPSPPLIAPSAKYENRPRCTLHDIHYRPPGVSINRQICKTMRVRNHSIPTKVLSISKSTSYNKLEPRFVGFVKTYVNKKRSKKSSGIKEKIRCFCKRSFRNLEAIADDADAQVWCGDAQCNFYYHRRKRKPYFWLFRCCPSMYPSFCKGYKVNQSVCHIILYVISACVWCPILCWVYVCYEVIFQCMK